MGKDVNVVIALLRQEADDYDDYETLFWCPPESRLADLLTFTMPAADSRRVGQLAADVLGKSLGVVRLPEPKLFSGRRQCLVVYVFDRGKALPRLPGGDWTQLRYVKPRWAKRLFVAALAHVLVGRSKSLPSLGQVMRNASSAWTAARKARRTPGHR